MPADDRMDPQFEQDERDDDRIKISRPEIAVPDAAHRLGREKVDGPEDDGEQRRRPDQRLDPDQLGTHHLLHQRMPEVG